MTAVTHDSRDVRQTRNPRLHATLAVHPPPRPVVGYLGKVSRPRVTLATCLDHPNLHSGEEGLPDALAERGIDVRVASWDDPDVDWAEAGVVVVRAVQNYAGKRDDFLRWARSIPKILNNSDVLEWNSDKHYLQEFSARGLNTIDTVWLEPERNLTKHQVHTRFPSQGEFVVKPAISGGARDAGRYTARDAVSRMEAIQHAYQLLSDGRSVMVQRYLDSVDVHGETALVYLNGVFSHAVGIEALLHGPVSAQSEQPTDVVSPRRPSAAELQAGEDARAVIHGHIKSRLGRDLQLLFCRIDLVKGADGTPTVMEISLVDADLYTSAVPDAAEEFAESIAARIFW